MSFDGVRRERTGWRDMELSRRHREWGFNCPGVDLDFLMVEYNLGRPVALVEYKYHEAQQPNLSHPTYRALRDLADCYRPKDLPEIEGLPFLLCFYWRDPWSFHVRSLNDRAYAAFGAEAFLSEREYVTALYRLRGLFIQEAVLNRLDVHLPPVCDMAAAGD